MPTTLAIAVDPTTQAPGTEDATELAFYHDYVDHYRIAEHYFHGNLLPDERNDFQTHLTGCAECADRVLLAELFDQESSVAPHQRAANVGKPTRNRPHFQQVSSEPVRSPRPQRIQRLPSETQTPGLPPIPSPSDSAALQSLIASIAMPAGPSQRNTASRRELQRESRQSRTTAPATDRPSIRLVPREEPPESPTKVEPAQTVASLPIVDAPKICSYLSEQKGRDGSPRLTCNLPMRARWVASFTPLELALIISFAALLLLAIPSAILMLSN